MSILTEAPRSPARIWSEHCRARRLAYQLTANGKPVFPPRLAEPGTGAPLQWAVSTGQGEVYATTVARRCDEPPQNIALITLDEGFRMMSTVIGVPPDQVVIGMRVRLMWRENDDESLPVPVFEAQA